MPIPMPPMAPRAEGWRPDGVGGCEREDMIWLWAEGVRAMPPPPRPPPEGCPRSMPMSGVPMPIPSICWAWAWACACACA